MGYFFFSTKKENDNLSTEVKKTGKKTTEISKKEHAHISSSNVEGERQGDRKNKGNIPS